MVNGVDHVFKFNYVDEYYSKLYNIDPHTKLLLKTRDSRATCLCSIPKLVTSEKKVKLIQPFTEEEVKEIVMSFFKSKTPSLDGILAKFFQVF